MDLDVEEYLVRECQILVVGPDGDGEIALVISPEGEGCTGHPVRPERHASRRYARGEGTRRVRVGYEADKTRIADDAVNRDG